METWHILIVIGIIAFIFEIFTAGFISASIGKSFFFAAVGNYFNLDTKWQILLFALGVGLAYFLARPVLMRYGYGSNKVRTNKDALLDKTGIVTEEINYAKKTGRVKIDGDDWNARSLNNEIIQIGTSVKILEIDSIILTVKPLN